MLPNPINLQDWIDEHRHLLKPPVGNKCIVDGDFIVMIVGGPRMRAPTITTRKARSGSTSSKARWCCDPGRWNVRDIPIRAGEMFYLPPRVPHSPQRMPANSIGLVIERKRLPHEDDG
jgi:3-hydroxyanthranilate 3,4-dioxygenase